MTVEHRHLRDGVAEDVDKGFVGSLHSGSEKLYCRCRREDLS
jgi:hypothetical protein